MEEKMRGYYPKKRLWQIRKKGFTVAKSIRQLSDHFGVDIPETERDSRPYWKRYIAELQEQTIEQKAKQLLAIPTTIQDHLPPILPTVARMQAFEQFKADPQFSQIVEATKVKKGAKGMLRTEINEFCKIKTGNHYRNSLDEFLKAVGNILIETIDIQTYRKWKQYLEENHKGAAVTTKNKFKFVKTFLRELAINHNLNFNFLNSRMLDKLNLPPDKPRDLREEYWTRGEIQQAIAQSGGLPLARFAILSGINLGLYPSDLTPDYFTPDKLQGNIYTTARKKNTREGVQKGQITSYCLWPETLEAYKALPATYTRRQIFYELKKLNKLTGIKKNQKGLRKTGAQRIKEIAGDAMARLYRNEGEMRVQEISYTTNQTTPIVEQLRILTDQLRTEFIL